MIVPQEVSDRLLAECLGRPQAYRELGWLCDHVGGRTSGLESGRQGEEWAARLLSHWGLENVHFEEFPVTAWSRGELQVQVTEPIAWKLTALSHGNAPVQADVTAPILNVGHGERSDFERLKAEVRGKIALCDEGVSEGKRALHRSEKLRLAVEYGAAGLMIFSSASGGLPRTGVCHRGESPIPSLGISQEDGARLLRLFAAGATPTVRIVMTNRFTQGTARNVIAELRGSELPEEVVLAGGHLDSWDVAQGATDNGLGTAIVLEMARALAALSVRPRRTVRFAVWAAEEIGLCGSWEYTRRHAEELLGFAGVMNFDMTADPFGYWAPRPLGKEKSLPTDPGMALLRGLADQLAALGMRQEFRYKAGLHSDHQAFMLAGVPIVGLQSENRTQGAHYYHSVGDTFEKVSLPAFVRAAAVGAHTLWALADAPERPFPTLDPAQVRQLIDEADLYEALVAENYDGPPMHS
ncbi:MAG TPA: M20/M25/M40 family metallo-hydrolase [Chthonomonadaceae bacterium]|nr:M20/M25/M40 family metallo-hydrolase [Chthonomonadaceae bacterium]